MTKPRGSIKRITATNWQIRFSYMHNGTRHHFKRAGFETKTEAHEALITAQMQLHISGTAHAKRQTVGAYLLNWFDTYSKSGTAKPSSLRCTKSHIENYLLPRIGSEMLGKITPQRIAALYADLLAGGRINATHKGRTAALSAKTVRNVGGTLHKAFQDAYEWGLLPKNPCEKVKLPKWDRPELKTWDYQQIAQFLTHATNSKDPFLAYWLLILTTGMRRGEVLGLRWSDVHLAAGVITIQQSRVSVGSEMMITTPKTAAGSRTVSIGANAVEALAQLLDAQEAAAKRLGGWYSDLVATDLAGQPIHPKALLKKFRQAANAAGVPPMHLHSGRHTSAAWQLEQGISPHIVSARLGHSDAGFTLKTYAKSLPAADKQATQILEAALADLIRNENGRIKGAQDALMTPNRNI